MHALCYFLIDLTGLLGVAHREPAPLQEQAGWERDQARRCPSQGRLSDPAHRQAH